MMTYPLIGNYGVNHEDIESPGLFRGFVVMSIVRLLIEESSELGEYLKENHILAMEGVDTRQLTLRIREQAR